ncbi:MAG TPA: MG2 domain-containing protein, partial [Blastocatellia bacterium]
DIETDAGEVIITGRRGGLVQTAEGEILLLHRSEILISTDKPLYQPGQSLLIRAMIFDESRRAIANAAATLTISDPDDAIVFRAPLRTSRFGIASASWAIPENTRLGRYRASIQMDDEKYRDFDAQQYIKITRYELPAFAVSVKPDRSYYLPGQSAEIEVRADYLFGQPVARGHVRVAREIDRLWNFTEQKWKIEEGEKYEGETDKTGKFVAHIDLTKEHEKLSETNYSRFRDVEYAAYFTDVTTGRTEQRRFDIRLTKDAIHVYVIDNNFNQAEALPMRFYLSTFYADGTPARCEVAVSEIFAKESSGSQAPLSSDVSGQTLRAIKTNAYGLAKVSDLALANRGGRGEDALLSFVARDSQGHTGHHTESFSLTARPTVRVETDKLLYRPGEPIKVSVTSTVPEMVVAVDLAQEGKVIRSEMVRVSAGRAALVFPYDRQFDGVLSIAAYSYGGLDTNRYTYPFDSRAVMYPRDRDLKLDMQLNEASYRPGEEARVNFRVLAPDGNAASSTLGVVVFDKAVEERARTDQEFGSGYDFNYSINNFLYSDSFAGVTRKDLEHLDLTKPLPEGLETVAGMLLHRGNYYPKIFAGNDYEYNQSSVFARAVKAQLEPVKGALSARYARKAEYPRDVKSLRRLLADFGIEFDKLRDPWGLPYRAVFKVEQKMDCLEFESAGADKRFGTEDDFIAG